ncbi:MAG: DUF928 domain-containing protein [Moorea sp. SIO2B7]|nr:DUF928 domain-containing protein [Moorena sp. SIO2B7]
MKKITLAYAIAFTFASLGYPQQIQAESNFTRSSITESVQVGFKQPDSKGNAPSGRDRGTGSRGDCPIASSGTEGKITLTPLIPSDSKGLTVEESPTIWIQVSYNSDQIEKEITGEFSLEDSETYLKVAPKQIPVTLPKTSGVFPVSIPHSLEVNKWYRWYLVFDCNSPDSSNDSVLSIEGIVQRVELPGLKSQLETQTRQERIAIYKDKGIWYDVLHEAAMLRCSNPENAAPWRELLRDDDVKLAEIEQYKLICSD